MRITIYNPAGIRTHKGIELEQGLGTAEIAVMQISRELVKLGHSVTIFTNTTIDFEDHGVKVVGDYKRPNDCDVLIVYRVPRIPENVTYGAVIFSSQDDIDCPAMNGLAEHAHEFQRIIVLSQYHADRCASIGVPVEKIRICPEGIIPESICDANNQSLMKEQAVCYASAPFKGLPLLARLWPEIRARHPELELRVYGSMHMHGSPENDARFYSLYDALKKMPGVTLYGSIPQRQLHKEIVKCKLMLYPNFYPETYGNSVQEAIALRCPVITSNIGALPEVVGDAGIIVLGDPKTAEYRAAFVNAVDEALNIWGYLYLNARYKKIPTYADCAMITHKILLEVVQ